MTDNLYSPPQANLELNMPQKPETPETILKKIRHAWIAGLFSTLLTLAVALWRVSGTGVWDYDIASFLEVVFESLLDVILMIVLTFGIFMKSRICAVLMVIYFLLGKVFVLFRGDFPVESIEVTSFMVTFLATSLLFSWLYIRGVVGTFQYHDFKKKNT